MEMLFKTLQHQHILAIWCMCLYNSMKRSEVANIGTKSHFCVIILCDKKTLSWITKLYSLMHIKQSNSAIKTDR